MSRSRADKLLAAQHCGGIVKEREEEENGEKYFFL
jgi:hypothetical protein